jgi:large subunit ribosomal protein L25
MPTGTTDGAGSAGVGAEAAGRSIRSDATVAAKRREGTGKGPARRLREAGLVPAIVYSRHGEPISISVDPKALRASLAGEARFNTLLTLKIEGDAKEKMVLLKDHQVDPVEQTRLLHADFLEVRMDEKIRIELPVVLKGKPVGVVEGGILQQNTRFLQVYCFPNKIPMQIEVDVSNLKVAQSIHVAELKMPEGAELKFSTNFTIAVVAIPEKEEVVVAPVAVAAEGTAAVAGAPGAAGAAPGQAPAAGAKAGEGAPAAAAKGGKPEGGGGKDKK